MYILSFSDTTKQFSKYANLHFDRHVWEAQFSHTLTNIFVILVDMWCIYCALMPFPHN